MSEVQTNIDNNFIAILICIVFECPTTLQGILEIDWP